VKKVFIGQTGQVRSGWVLLAFGALTALTQWPLGIAFRGLFPAGDGPVLLDEWQIAAFTWPTLFSSLFATAVCAKVFREKVGLERPRLFYFGLALGGGALLLAVGVPTLLGYGTLSAPEHALSVVFVSGVMQLITVGATSVGEELLFRGLPFQALARGTHQSVAIGSTSLLFGLGHLNNPNSSLVAASNVALVGIWFGLLAWRYSLWATIGLHVAWNWFEGFVFGQPVSGLTPGPSLFHATWVHQRGFWAGGDFGPEASGWTTVILTFGIVLVLLISRPKPRNSGPEPVLHPE